MFSRSLDIPMSIPIPRDSNLADTLYNHLQEDIQERLARLRTDEQLAIFYHVAPGEVITVTKFGYHNPNLIFVYGLDADQNKTTVIVHMSSLQLVMKILKTDKKTPKHEIGFLGNVKKPQSADAQDV